MLVVPCGFLWSSLGSSQDPCKILAGSLQDPHRILAAILADLGKFWESSGKVLESGKVIKIMCFYK
jgi:hypothetical protein